MVFNKAHFPCICFAFMAGIPGHLTGGSAVRSGLLRSQTGSPFLPLAAGDTWVYQRSILGKQVLGWGWRFDLEGETPVHPRFQTIQTSRLANDPEHSEETYRILRKTSKDGQDAWEVSVQPPSARDQRYQGLQKVLWSVGTDPLVKAPDYWFQERIYKRIQDWDGGGFKQKDALLTTRFLLVPADGSSVLKIGVGSENNPEFASGKLVTVVVPAGRYGNCLEVITTVKVPGQGGEETWTIRTYYSRNVGMVKEVQLAPSGEPVYTLELKSFQHAGKLGVVKKH